MDGGVFVEGLVEEAFGGPEFTQDGTAVDSILVLEGLVVNFDSDELLRGLVGPGVSYRILLFSAHSMEEVNNILLFLGTPARRPSGSQNFAT